jgi:simple sugar transport system permease protein
MLSLRRIVQREISLFILIIITVFVLFLLGLLLKDKFFSLNNFQSMAFQIPEFGFLALAMSITMLSGGIDLSLVANANLAGILAAYVLTGKVIPINGNETTIIILACFVALFASTLAGVLNGLLISKLSVPPILATLGTMTFYNGISMALTSGQGVVGFPEAFLDIGSKDIINIPIIFILFIIATVIVSFFLEKTTTGRRIYLLGENPIASLFAGIKNENLITRVYLLSGLLAGFASIIMISKVNSAKVGYGDTYLLQAILVAVLGGIDPNGGRGRVIGVMLGIFILQFLQSAFTLFAFTPYAKKLIWGFMLLLVMVINFLVGKAQAKQPKTSEAVDI